MKKFLYLLPFAAFAMASCSNSEDVVQTAPAAENQEVKLFPSVGGNTRGTVETTASIASFDVILNGNFATTVTGAGAVNSYGPVNVTKGASGWSMASQYYWGDATTAGKFTAYANSAVAASEGKLAGIGVAAAVGSQKDLLVAYNEGTKTDFTTGVPLHFRHAMSQIVVKASYNDDASLVGDYPSKVVKVKGIKFFNLNNTGTLTLPTASTASGEDYEPAWSGHTGAVPFEVPLTSEVTLGSTATSIDLSEAADPLLLLPQTTAATTAFPLASDATAGIASATGAYLAVLVDINEADGSDYYPKTGYTTDGGYAWVAVPVSIEWKGGSKYIYTLNFANTALGSVAPGTDAGAIPEGKYAGSPLPAALLTPVNFLVTVEDEWTEYPLTPSF